VDCACDCDCACPVDDLSSDEASSCGVTIPTLDLPVAYYLELTPACQNRCPGCGNVFAADRDDTSVILRSERKPGFRRDEESLSRPMDGDAWRALLARLAPHTHHLKLTGGEPTLHPAFAHIVRAIDGHGIPFALFTNGCWADPEGLIRLLRDTPACDGLLVSLHGPDARTHEAFSGVPGSFVETAANLRRAAHAGLDVATSLVITRHNWDRVEETLKQALRLGANHVVCNRWIGASDEAVILRSASDEESPATPAHYLHPRDSSLPPVAQNDLDSSRLAQVLAPSEDQLRAAISTIEALRADGQPIRFGNCIPQCFEASSSTGCTSGRTFATIDPWGRVRPCNHAPWVAGDLGTQAMDEIWHGQVMAAWRGLVPAGCAGCAAYARCHGGCRAQALLAGRACDPLMGKALAEVPAAEEELRLYGGLRPVGRYVRRDEGGRDVLIYKSKTSSVPSTCRGLWYKLDGSLALSEMEQQYGAPGLAWVGRLYRRGMIAWPADSL
jgi:radical SAM protein with 4Fe4S-binding SPASM domain